METSAKAIRVYADTSVFGGVFDEEFSPASRAFFEQVRRGRFVLVTSALVWAEVEPAPAEVREFFDAVRQQAEIVEPGAAAVRLRDAYLASSIVSAQYRDDALHVALATTARCPIIVSWNFSHIVHFEKIPLYNAVDRAEGFDAIAIHSPREVIAYEDQDV